MADLRQISMAFESFPDNPQEKEAPPVQKKKKGREPLMVGLEHLPAPALLKKSTRGRKPIRVLEQEADLIDIPDDETLFAKQYYSMSEVTAMFRVTHSLLRYWENEFDILKPRKNRKGDRLFRPEDVKSLQLIYYLLRQKKYTMDGAKDYLKHKDRAAEKHKSVQALEKIKSFLLEIKAGL